MHNTKQLICTRGSEQNEITGLDLLLVVSRWLGTRWIELLVKQHRNKYYFYL